MTMNNEIIMMVVGMKRMEIFKVAIVAEVNPIERPAQMMEDK